ncbi:MAG TPA: amidohydrolase [Candidatus Pygmaiobacter gallistercoris]|nr:amidohydrolase [Candidatus Pygmaiobacter gallistercoris]
MMDYRAKAIEMKDEILQNRRTLHGYAETGFDLDKTLALVERELKSYGLSPERVGRAGISCMVGSGAGPTLLLRADMDALPMQEETGLPFAATNGHCHSCGHDCHTAMLLAAAKLLKESEGELKGRVKLMFQPAEEKLAGAPDMLAAGILENPKVDAALAMHIFVGGDESCRTGQIAYKRGCASYSGDAIRITVTGKNAHGGSPQDGVDAINIASHIVIALQEILAREVSSTDQAVVLVGMINGGTSCNTMSGSCVLEASVRSDSREQRAFLKKRVKEISESVATTFRGKAEVEFVYGMPSLYNEEGMCDAMGGYCRELLGEDAVTELTTMSGSEDFTVIAEQVPSVYLNLGGGSAAQGHLCGMHHPGMTVDEDALPIGAAVYAYCAARYLEEH